MRFTILLRKGEDSGYVAECPAIPGCVSQGNTAAVARKNIKEAIFACLEVMNETARQKARKTSSRIIQVAI